MKLVVCLSGSERSIPASFQSTNGLRNRYHTMALRCFTRHLGVNASALSRCADRPNAEVIVIADLRYKLSLKHIPIANCKAWHHRATVGYCHLEAISAAAFQSKGKGCIRDHRTDSGGSPHTLPRSDRHRCSGCKRRFVAA